MSRLGPAPSSSSRLPGIEGIRALAAGSIVLFHVWRYASPDGTQFDLGPFDRLFRHFPLGVTLFFTLSGFLLYRPFASALMRQDRVPDIRAYFRNRALRILPAYWVILLLTGLVLQATFVRRSAFELQTGSLASHPTLLLRDAAFVQNYSPSTLLTGIGPAWSLAIEVVFYLTLPLLAALGFTVAARASTRRGRRLAALVPPLALLVVGLSGKAVATFVVPGLGPGAGWVGDWHSVLERSFWAQADLFTFGMALAVLRVDAEDGLLRLPRWWMGIAAAGVVLVALPTAVLADRGALGPYPYDTSMALVCALVLAMVVLSPERAPSSARRSDDRTFARRLIRTLESRPLVMTGLISYSLYLWHEPLIRWMQQHGLTLGGSAGFVLDVLILGAISWLLAAATYRFVEMPALARKTRRAPVERGRTDLSDHSSEPATR